MLRNNYLKYFILVFSLILFFSILFVGEKKIKEEQSVSFPVFLEKVKNGEVKEINLENETNFTFITQDNKVFNSNKDPNVSFWEVFEKEKIPKEVYLKIKITKKTEASWLQLFLSFLINVIPIIIITWFIWQIFRQTQRGTSQIFSFGKSGIKVYNPNDPNRITFKDVAGLEEAKQELMEVVEFLKNPEKFFKIGARIPKGVLLVGPPGTGKTMLAQATASEAGVPFFYISGSEFVEMFVGVGASVTGDTPILIKRGNKIKLTTIGKFVDKFYQENESGFVKFIDGYETLGYEPQRKVYFGKPIWTNIRGVFRHKVNEIYEIYFRGGKIKTTGDHSVFVREKNRIIPKKVSELKVGDCLVNLPFKRRSVFVKGIGTTHKISTFDLEEKEIYLDLYEKEYNKALFSYQFALENRNILSQAKIGKILGLAQTTIKDWQLGRRRPKIFSSFNIFRFKIPPKIKVDLDLMKLLGYYVAEGRTTDYFTQFVFGIHERDLIKDCSNLIEKIFNITPHIKDCPETNSCRITIYSSIISKFFKKHCGTGAKKKHIPPFLWQIPFPYFKSFLEGLYRGDGYITKEGKLIITTTSRRLALELIWLSALHGIQVGLRKTKSPERKIREKILKPSKYYLVIFGKTSNPFLKNKKTSQPKKPIITKIIKKPYDGYVYDLCGCDNEAFFGGEKPILLHNSRVRDAFSVAKRNQPCLTGDTIITLSNGEEITIKEIYEKKLIGKEVLAFDENLNLKTAKIIGVSKTPDQEILKISTIIDTIKLTPDHLLPTLKDGRLEWVEAKELKEGDFIAYPKKIPEEFRIQSIRTLTLIPEETRIYFKNNCLPKIYGNKKYYHSVKLKEIYLDKIDEENIAWIALGKGGFTDSYLYRIPKYLNEDILYLKGLIDGDGSYHKNKFNITFVNTELYLHQEVKKIVLDNFGISAKTYKNKKYYRNLPQGKPPQNLKDCYTTHINNKLVKIILKNIDEILLSLPNNLIAAWIRGIFDSDGYVASIKNHPKIVITSTDETLNKKIRSALLRLGIIGYCTASNNFGNIEITGKENIKRFREIVGSNHPKKLQRLKNLNLEGVRFWRLNQIPLGLLLKEARISLGIGQRSFKNGHMISCWERNIHLPSLENLEIKVKEMEKIISEKNLSPTQSFEKLKSFVYGDVSWVKIKKIEKVNQKEDVYDLILDKYHNFIANNHFVHNCILFIDELDAIGKIRGAGITGAHEEREQTLNQILVEMDGFEKGTKVVVLAATNRPDVLDPALLRPGRFDRKIVLDLPDIKAREEILKIHLRDKRVGKVNLRQVAERTPGFSGADLANLCNEAAILAARRNKEFITQQELLDSIEKVLLGPERKTKAYSKKEKEIAAYHEAGHAIVAHYLPYTNPVQKISIISRGRAGGYTLKTPLEDRSFYFKKEFLDELASMLGGYAAEKLIFNDITTGASNDLEIATDLTRQLVTKFGMSEKLGPISISQKPKEFVLEKEYSEKTAELIDEEVKNIIHQALERATKVLEIKKDKLEKVAQVLIKKEVIEKKQFERLVGEKKGSLNI